MNGPVAEPVKPRLLIRIICTFLDKLLGVIGIAVGTVAVKRFLRASIDTDILAIVVLVADSIWILVFPDHGPVPGGAVLVILCAFLPIVPFSDHPRVVAVVPDRREA